MEEGGYKGTNIPGPTIYGRHDGGKATIQTEDLVGDLDAHIDNNLAAECV